MLQVSMDGASVNWALYDELRKHREREELPSLINIDSCGLHIVHGALKTCVTTTELNLKGILKSIYTLLHDIPAKDDKVDQAAMKNFKELDFTLNDNQLPLNSINIGCAAIGYWMSQTTR